MRAGALAIDLFGGGTERPQDVLGERQGDLAFARVHAVGARFLQAAEIAEIGAPRQHADVRFSSRATRITSGLFSMPADVRISVPEDATPALASVSGRVASPYTASISCSRSCRTVSTFTSTTVGATPFSRSSRVTVRPVGP